jgi:LysM repeat protein
MSKKLLTIIVIGLIALTLLAACERPASTGPVATPTGGDIPFPVQQPTTSLGLLATQTAAAKNPTGPTATNAPGVVNPTAVKPQPTADGAVATQIPPAPVATVTPKPQIVVPTATPGRPATYTIQQGDHYLCIARRFNLSPEEFLSLNNLTMNSLAVVGGSVKIPQGGTWPSSFGERALKAHPDSYSVQSGDTLNKIACGYGDVDPNSIIAANNLKSPFLVTAGQTLDIP